MMLNYQSQAVQQPVPAARHARVCFVRPNVKICARDRNDAASLGASELQALVCDLAGFQSDACKALLHEADVLKTVKALASGDNNHAIEYFGDPLGISALAKLLEPHATPEQQQALSAAAVAAAAVPPKLSAREEAMQLLQEPLVKTAFNRMRTDPVLGLSTYGQNPAVSKTMGLLDQVLAEDQHTSQVVEFMVSAAAAQRSCEADQQHARQQREQHLNRQRAQEHSNQQQRRRQQRIEHAWPVLDNDQQERQLHKQQGPARQRTAKPAPARTAVIARSAGDAAAGRGPSAKP